MKLQKSRTSHVEVDLKSRRMFLNSVGGLSVALPFLPSLLTVFSERALASTAVPLRYVQLFTPLGGLQHKNWLGTNLPTNPFQLYPGKTARIGNLSSLAGSNGISTVLNSSFQNLFPLMNLIAGVDSTSYWGHHRGFTHGGFCRNVLNFPPVSDQTTLNGKIDTDFPTIDQVLVNAGGNGIYGSSISGRRRQLNMTSLGGTSSWGRDDYFDSSSPVIPKDALDTTSGAFNYLFGSVQQGPNGNSTNPLLNLVNEFWPTGRSIFKFLSGDDKKTLASFFDLAQKASNDYSAPIPSVGNIVKPPGTSAVWNHDGSSLRALADIIVLAFQSDMTRVVTFYCGDANGLEWHPLSHAPSEAAPNEGQDGIVSIHNLIAQNFYGYLGEKLRTTPDPMQNGSGLLDNSVMMWTHEHKCAHQNVSTPTVLLGSAGGRINTGNFVDLRNKEMGVTGKDVTGDSEYQGDIINRLWASLFYAFNIPKSAYELTRGGSGAESLTKGYGHIMKNDASHYDLSQIGEPWDFIKKTGIPWG